tara:strand:+ start:1628 stop:3484 length:1857 start_codon:yes stop_codon:yes gene_type:complete
MKKYSFTITFSCLLVLNVLNAQVLLKEVPLEKQIENSSLVVEGKVISKQSFWDAKRHNIYTSNTVEVLKVFKGEAIETIDVITLGGVVGSEALIVSPNLKLQKDDTGIFTLYDNNIVLENQKNTANKQFKTYSSLQGFYKYNLYTDVAVNPFSKKTGIQSSFYDEIMNYTKSKYIEIKGFNIKSKTSQNKAFLRPEEIRFDLTTATAGTKTVLTISGSGFGMDKGKVGFSNADDGGGTFVVAIDSQILTWEDDEITVEIPSDAGTGPILVQDEAGANGFSASDLTITYAEANAIFDPDDDSDNMPSGVDGPLGFYAYPIRHISDNGSGGYTWQMETNFFNDVEFSGAKGDFENALDKWRCATKVNWTISNLATTVDVIASDGVNVVKFDDQTVPADDLDDGVLGQCLSRISGCGFPTIPSSWNAHVVELDIVFDDETNWHFGTGLPNGSQYDFESVALHELGHGHQLGHVIDQVINGNNLDDVMHYAIANGSQQRLLTSGNITAANNVHSRSTSVVACGQTLMTNSTICNLSVDDNELADAVSIFPNPAKDEFFIKNESFINLQKAVIYDISGRQISEYDLSETSRIKNINIQNFSKGIYIVSIHTNKASISKKLILD